VLTRDFMSDKGRLLGLGLRVVSCMMTIYVVYGTLIF